MNEASTENNGNADNQGSSRSLMASESHHSHNSYSLGDVIFPRGRHAVLHAPAPPTTPPLHKTNSRRFGRTLSESLPSLPMFNKATSKVSAEKVFGSQDDDVSSDKHQSSMSSLSDSPVKQSHKGHVRFDETAFRRMSLGKGASMVVCDDSFASLDLEVDVPNRDDVPMSPLNMNSPWIRPKRAMSSRTLINSLDLAALEGGGSDELKGPSAVKDAGSADQKREGRHFDDDDDESVAAASVSSNGQDEEEEYTGGGESSSSQDLEGVGTTSKANADEEDDLQSEVRLETSMIRALRFVYYIVLTGVAACAVAMSYMGSASSDSFREQFDATASVLVSNLLQETETKALLAFTTASSITEMMEVGRKSAINVTFSFKSVAGAQLNASSADSFSWGPLLATQSELKEFESLLRGSVFRIDSVNASHVVDDSSQPPFFPIRYGLGESEDLTLYNQFSDEHRSKSLRGMISTKRQCVSGLFVRQGGLNNLMGGVGGAGFVMSTPVFLHRDGLELAGAIVSEYTWRNFLRKAVNPPFSDLVDIVIESSCGGNFTFRLNLNGELILMAADDIHEERFEGSHHASLYSDLDHILPQTVMGESAAGPAGACRYRYSVYATTEMEAHFQSNNSALVAVVTLLVFAVIALLSAWCDFIVAKRHRKVFEAARRSTKIVSSLFPKSCRGRLFDEAVDGGSICTPGGSSTAGKSAAGSWKGGAGDGSTVPCTNSTVSGYSSKRFRSNDHQRSLLRSFLEASPGEETTNMEAIADFYPEATVMMLDIQGFTAWASEREPVMVFKLLETIFRSFDEATRRYGVFKIETIGDSYVCVTGVPDPNSDHAVAMTRFAFECLRRFNRLTKQLETQLGPSTGDLQARIGMHSGSVTAGVIRGERARFQLFGDTMNTTSRMESNGLPGQIQVSEATAQFLRQAGKERWLSARKELVDAKGKGKMQTYWVSPSRKARRSGQGASSSDGNSEAGESLYCQDIHLDTSSLDPNHDSIDFQIQEASRVGKCMRLVDWNVEILSGFLRKVIAGRDPAGGRPRMSRGGSKPSVFASDGEMRSLGVNRGGSVFDEVTEAIDMPRFDIRQTRRIAESDRIELDRIVKAQLREYVMRIASMYRSLDFHDFERASHVTMSASKLLGRLTKRPAGDSDRPGDDEREIHNASFGIVSDPLLQFAIVLAALIHDVDHHGLTNAQLVERKTPTAIMYKNRSVSQQNSFDVAWAVLMDSDFDQLRGSIYGTSRVEFRRFRQLLIRCVLATDVSDPALSASRLERWQRAFGSGGGGDDLKATVVVEAIAQATDVAHAMQHWITFSKWSEREFKERWAAAGSVLDMDPALPSSSMPDPHSASGDWYAHQLRVLDGHVIPLARRLNESGVFGPNSRELLCWATENRRQWEQHGPSLVDRMTTTTTTRQDGRRPRPPPHKAPSARHPRPERRRSSCSGVSSGARTSGSYGYS